MKPSVILYKALPENLQKRLEDHFTVTRVKDLSPDTVAQQFYDYRIQHRSNDLTGLRPYLSDGLAKLLNDATRDPQHNAQLKFDLFSIRTTLPDSAEVASASTIPNTDARNIPLRVKLTQGTQTWQDEVLMIREGQCWAVDDVRYLGAAVHAPSGTLRQSLAHP